MDQPKSQTRMECCHAFIALFFEFVINTTAYHLGLYLLLLKSSMIEHYTTKISYTRRKLKLGTLSDPRRYYIKSYYSQCVHFTTCTFKAIWQREAATDSSFGAKPLKSKLKCSLWGIHSFNDFVTLTNGVRAMGMAQKCVLLSIRNKW